MDMFFEIAGIVVVAVSAFSALAVVGNRLVDHLLGFSPFQRLAKRVDKLEANPSAYGDSLCARLDAQKAFIFDIAIRLDALEAKPTAKAK